MEREEGKIVVRTSHHWPHRSVETETSKLGKGEREGMETQDMGGGDRRPGAQRDPSILSGDMACYDDCEPDTGLTKFLMTQVLFKHS